MWLFRLAVSLPLTVGLLLLRMLPSWVLPTAAVVFGLAVLAWEVWK